MKRFFLIVTVSLLAIGGLVAYRSAEKKKASATPDPSTLAIPVLTGHAVTADVPITLDGIGTVQALNTVNIKPMVDGPIVEIRFREGQDVKRGDLLARIDPRTYQAAYDQAVAKKAQDEATLANAQRDLTRYDKLAKSQYSTAQQADTQRSTVAQTEAIVRQDQAQIDTARTNLSYTAITAPVDGRAGIRQVDIGNLVHGSDTVPITVVTTLRPISVVFTLPQQTLPAVAAAMEADRAMGGPVVDALPQTGVTGDATSDQVLDTGHVSVLDNQVDQNTGTIKLKATFPNPALRLWPGAFVNVRLALSVQRGVTTVPIAAVQRGPQGAFVYVVRPDDTVERRIIMVPHQDDVRAVVASGLKPGETVVTDGASRLTDGAHVKRLAPDGST